MGLHRVVGKAKQSLLRDEERIRRVKFGLARGQEMRINRSRNIRPEIGLYELPISKIFRRFATTSRVAYDIGANSGYYSLAFLRFGVAQVIAYEPDPEPLRLLEEIVEKHPRGPALRLIREPVGSHASQDSVAIDELIASGEVPAADTIKMDIDGGEVEALVGMSHLLETHGPNLIVEVHSLELQAGCIELLKQAGYGQIVSMDHSPLAKKVLPETRGVSHNIWLAASRNLPLGSGHRDLFRIVAPVG